jgi:hypothetical protein
MVMVDAIDALYSSLLAAATFPEGTGSLAWNQVLSAWSIMLQPIPIHKPDTLTHRFFQLKLLGFLDFFWRFGESSIHH